MDEYISKQRAKDRMGCCLASVKAEYKAAKNEFTKARFGDYISAIQSMIDVVGSVEAADVQPVKHGRWIYSDTPIFGNPYGRYLCSICDFAMDDRDYKFCPNCGADMRGDTD